MERGDQSDAATTVYIRIWEDNVLEGLGEEYDDRPVAGLFGTLEEAQTEFLRANQGFEAE
jgi:hypothetical protein